MLMLILLFSIVVRTLRPRQPRRIGQGRTVGCCCCCLSMSDGHLLRMSPSIRTTAVSRLALGRKQRTTVAGSFVAGMMGMMGKMGTVFVCLVSDEGGGGRWEFLCVK